LKVQTVIQYLKMTTCNPIRRIVGESMATQQSLLRLPTLPKELKLRINSGRTKFQAFRGSHSRLPSRPAYGSRFRAILCDFAATGTFKIALLANRFDMFVFLALSMIPQ
jgi:hypothetical protein